MSTPFTLCRFLIPDSREHVHAPSSAKINLPLSYFTQNNIPWKSGSRRKKRKTGKRSCAHHNSLAGMLHLLEISGTYMWTCVSFVAPLISSPWIPVHHQFCYFFQEISYQMIVARQQHPCFSFFFSYKMRTVHLVPVSAYNRHNVGRIRFKLSLRRGYS